MWMRKSDYRRCLQCYTITVNTITSRQQGPRHYHHALRHYLWNLPPAEQWRKDDVIRVPYDSNVIVYFIPENRAKTQLLSGFRPVRVLLRSLKGDSRNKAKKVAIHRLTRTRYHSARMRPPRLRPRRSHLPSSRLKLELELPSLASKPSCFFWFERHVIHDGSGGI